MQKLYNELFKRNLYTRGYGDFLTQFQSPDKKRKLYEGLDFPQRRIQTFSPASGKPSVNKVINNLNQFIDESFANGEHNTEHTYIKRPSKKNCRWCEFNQTEHCDSGVK